jgi:hypothetical protein
MDQLPQKPVHIHRVRLTRRLNEFVKNGTLFRNLYLWVIILIRSKLAATLQSCDSKEADEYNALTKSTLYTHIL